MDEAYNMKVYVNGPDVLNICCINIHLLHPHTKSVERKQNTEKVKYEKKKKKKKRLPSQCIVKSIIVFESKEQELSKCRTKRWLYWKEKCGGIEKKQIWGDTKANGLGVILNKSDDYGMKTRKDTWIELIF